MKRWLITCLLLCLTSCSSEVSREYVADDVQAYGSSLTHLEGIERSSSPDNVEDIDLFFKILPLAKENEKTIMMVDIFSPVAAYNSLGMTEIRMARFLGQLHRFFPASEPDQIRFTHHDVGFHPIFSLTFTLAELPSVSSFHKKDFQLLDMGVVFDRINKTIADHMIIRYCARADKANGHFCNAAYAKWLADCLVSSEKCIYQDTSSGESSDFDLPARGSRLLRD